MAIDIAASINNSCVHILNKYEPRYCQAVRYNVTEMERKEPEALSNGPVIVIHRWLIALILERLRYASADQ